MCWLAPGSPEALTVDGYLAIKTMLYGKEPPKVETDNDVEAMAK